jgi:D-3-phosphoglycerate dehydrogenase / 2-oxoglutarate reductase
MKKVLITDAVDEKSAALFREAGYHVHYQPGMPPEEIKKVIPDYNILIVRSETDVNSELISLMDNMEIIGRAGTGTDNIDVAASTRKGIIVMNTPGGNTISTAEHTIALMLSMCRNIPQAAQSMREGKWERKTFKGTELFGKTLGIIGIGKIGKEVASRCKAFGMEIIGYDPVISEEVTGRMGIKPVDLETLFRTSDIITVHVPLTDETKYLISKETLSKCKDGVRIINCARGGIVSETDLLEAINSGKAAGAALDVYENEPPGKSEVVTNHKITVTPHLGASTGEAQTKVAVQIANQIINYNNTGSLQGGVNADSVIQIKNEELLPFVELAEKIGRFHSYLLKGHLKKIEIIFCGILLHEYTPLLSSSFLKGFLSELRSDTVNLINSIYLAKESGISINEVKAGENVTYRNLITVKCESEKEKRSISGTVFGNNELRIVEIDRFTMELKPEGNLIIYKNVDKPGVLAMVSGILAENKINIGGLSLGRVQAGKEALTIISIDSNIAGEIVKNISGIDGIKEVYAVSI